MTKIKLAFQGEKGAYSHIACEEIFKGANVKNCKTLISQNLFFNNTFS